MGFVCCQPWQRSAWPHHCPHAPAGSSYSSREGSLLCCCPFCACSTEFKCHQCDTVWGRTQTNLESLTSAHRGEKSKNQKLIHKSSSRSQPGTSQCLELLHGLPLGVSHAIMGSWMLKAAGEVVKLFHTSLGSGVSPWWRPIYHDTYTSITQRENSKKISRGLSALIHIWL